MSERKRATSIFMCRDSADLYPPHLVSECILAQTQGCDLLRDCSWQQQSSVRTWDNEVASFNPALNSHSRP